MASSEPLVASARTRVVGPQSRVGGKYVLLREIAKGGMGDVWLARNETTDAQVALKILRPSNDVRTQAEERFRREAKLGGLLGHRSIVRIYDFLEEPDGALVLVLELLRGDTLEQHLQKRGPLSPQEAVAIAAPLLSALQHGHDHGVVHRDVKPANVFLALEPDGRVIPKLLDFGIAKLPRASTKTENGLVLGTPSYMSPEQIRADEELDGRSDLFSMGVVLYEMMTGTCPFQATGPGASIAAVLSSAVDPDPRIDPRLWLEVQRALSKRPAERHASAAEMATALCAAIGETEDTVGGVLRRTKPPPSLAEIADILGPESGARPAKPAAETQSFEGQSVAMSVPKAKVPRWLTWALAGVAAAVIATVAFARGRTMPAAPAAAHATAVETAASPVPPPPSTAPSSELAPAVPAAPAAAASAEPTKASAAPTSKAAPAHVPGRTHRSPRGGRPKPLATTPGF